MKRLIIVLVLTVVSCNYFKNKKISSQDIVTQKMQTINWSEVDVYPSFSVCDSVSQKQAQKSCFENTILQHVNNYLSQQHIVVSEDIKDTITMQLAIGNTGDIRVLNISKKEKTRLLIPEIDSLLKGSITTLPKIYPAIKRSQLVNTEFILPVAISIE